jgi:putative transposase
VKYNPDKHHRRSIRLKGYDYSSPGAYFITICTYQRECWFGEIVDCEMRLNEFGKMVNAFWQRLPFHFLNLQLDAFVVMPNHVHGILVLTDQPRRGAALGQDLEDNTDDLNPNATPHHNPLSEPGVAFGTKLLGSSQDGLPNAAPLPSRLGTGTVGAIVLNFKSVTTRSFNRMKRSPGGSIWQRNYYEHIIRSEEALQHIRQYVYNNPITWQQDQLHPDNPSKW